MAKKPKGRKRPVTTALVRGGKRPFAGAPTLSDSGNQIAWRLSVLDLEGQWGWNRISSRKLMEVREKLAALERFEWAQLDHGKHHRIAVADLSAEAKKRLETINQDEVDALHSLRLAGAERLWVILHGNVCYLLWWDPDHTVYPSKKKHT